ncbi:F-box protein CPR30 [Heracleum sosnowskyi]|uniref:F-box protein CPR30 n=1 Tax=Heracleum sosnowskyi TaxID=360622 RepID=A0AAD8I292_9APIA|nr:F-box protein CPR30 [Heracleum sosnowskyi]
MSDVPSKIINIIFSYLPVKSLLRFRCVSKSCRALIDSPCFIKSHLNQSLVSNSHQTLIFTLTEYDQIRSTNFDSLDEPTLLTPPAYRYRVSCSCNGLLCLYNGKLLYNPSTREEKTLPYPGISCDADDHYGFGYDCVNDDYKVVRIVESDDEYSMHSVFVVYSLKSNSWGRIKDFPYFIGTKGSLNVCVNGALHWSVTLKSEIEDFVRLDLPEFIYESKIVSFNLATEKFGLIPLPKFRDRYFSVIVAELGGRLSVHCSYDLSHIDIWVMSCYGVKESWSKLLTVSQPADISRFVDVQAIAYSLDGKRVLLKKEDGQIYWYDLELKQVKPITIPGVPNICGPHLCVGSLVKLSGAAETDVSRDETTENTSRFDQMCQRSFYESGKKSRRRVLLKQEDGNICWYDLERKRVKRITIPGLPNISSTHLSVGSLVKFSGAAKTDVSRDKTRKKSHKNIQIN